MGTKGGHQSFARHSGETIKFVAVLKDGGILHAIFGKGALKTANPRAGISKIKSVHKKKL